MAKTITQQQQDYDIVKLCLAAKLIGEANENDKDAELDDVIKTCNRKAEDKRKKEKPGKEDNGGGKKK